MRILTQNTFKEEKKMTRFVSVRNEQVAELVSRTDEQVVLKMEGGKEKSISPATLKRWWKEIEEPQTEETTSTEEVVAETEITLTEAEMEYVEHDVAVIEEMTQPEENADEQTEVDPVIEEEPVAKIEKKKESKKPREKISGEHPLKVFIEQLSEERQTEVFVATVPSFRSLKVDGRMYMAFTFNKKGVTLWMRSKAVEELTEYKKTNHMFDARVHFGEDTLENRKEIEKLLDASLEFQKNKQAGKASKQ